MSSLARTSLRYVFVTWAMSSSGMTSELQVLAAADDAVVDALEDVGGTFDGAEDADLLDGLVGEFRGDRGLDSQDPDDEDLELLALKPGRFQLGSHQQLVADPR